MDFGRLKADELKQGYRFDAETSAYICITCGEQFNTEQVYPMDGKFYTAEYAAARHSELAHGSNALRLIDADTKYNTLTDNQKELLRLIASGTADKDIAGQLGITEATVRRQRFNFREKAKQAKLYLAMYAQVFETVAHDTLMPIPDQAPFVDDRFVITEQERAKMLKGLFSSLEPLRLKAFPPKEKKKIVVLAEIAGQFAHGRRYTEREVNEILKPIYADYVTIRRYLISYGLMSRTRDGSAYWMAE
ncbi:MAG TPA: DUF2087 domain-containing protein [Candidatus Limiplasma sp.]|nr:DUF2087 domain-containing protein [Candidatus Limiplasma sp.]